MSMKMSMSLFGNTQNCMPAKINDSTVRFAVKAHTWGQALGHD